MTPAERADALVALAPTFALVLLCALVVHTHLDNAARILDQRKAARRAASTRRRSEALTGPSGSGHMRPAEAADSVSRRR